MSKKQKKTSRSTRTAKRRLLPGWIAVTLLAVLGTLGIFAFRSKEKMVTLHGREVAEGVLERIPGLETESFTGRLRPLMEKTDPRKDTGWESEVFSEAAAK